MTIQADFWHLVGLLLSFIAVLATFGKLLFDKIEKRVDSVDARIDSTGKGLTERIARLEQDYTQHKTTLPLEYQRREDAIRFETVLNAKPDAIGTRIERLVERAQNYDSRL